MQFINKLTYWLYHITHCRTGEFMEFINFLHRMDALSIYYLGGPNKALQVTGDLNDYHWFKFSSQKGNRFYRSMNIVFENATGGLTDRQVCIQIPSDQFTRKEIMFLNRFILSLPSSNTNIISTNVFNTNVAEAVSKHFYRIEGRMCVYTIK